MSCRKGSGCTCFEHKTIAKIKPYNEFLALLFVIREKIKQWSDSVSESDKVSWEFKSIEDTLELIKEIEENIEEVMFIDKKCQYFYLFEVLHTIVKGPGEKGRMAIKINISAENVNPMIDPKVKKIRELIHTVAKLYGFMSSTAGKAKGGSCISVVRHFSKIFSSREGEGYGLPKCVEDMGIKWKGVCRHCNLMLKDHRKHSAKIISGPKPVNRDIGEWCCSMHDANTEKFSFKIRVKFQCPDTNTRKVVMVLLPLRLQNNQHKWCRTKLEYHNRKDNGDIDIDMHIGI